MNHRHAEQPQNSAENTETVSSSHKGAQKPFVNQGKVDAVGLLRREDKI